MPLMIERLFDTEMPTKHYKFVLTPEEGKKFLNEIPDFWDESKIPDDEEVKVKVEFTIDFYKKVLVIEDNLEISK